ncbi:unnamed protein product [Bursaphelenchus okinawaensis]|uniref:DZF domain-containing protein n=1 Tax=Bursaphelenchus okinawaensis TaxID=465554 RepID=A0A811JUJ9_9BILA|nr:unnamed protein product [Bursaphelenchus okinawaensis]CAG9083755.1 unnamed protein product [Bursaphelenchus okinawaensis]
MYGYDQQRQGTQKVNYNNYASPAAAAGQASALMTYNNYIQSLGQNSAAAGYGGMETYGTTNPAAAAAGYGQAMDTYGNAGNYTRTYATASSNNIPLGGGNGYSTYTTQPAVRTGRTNSTFGVMNAGVNKRVVGRAAWTKKPKVPKPPVDLRQYFCETCNVSCGGPQAYQDHLAGKSHKRKEEALKKGDVGLPKNKKSYKCEVCNVTCSSKEAFDTHIAGAKHNKAVNTLKKMGKPIPESVINVIMPHGEPTQHLPVNKKVVGVTSTAFVGGKDLTTTKNGEEEEDTLDESEEVQVPPVGEEFLDEVKGGKVTSYFCKLCECTCGDPSARNLHVRGRRHRLQYKMKVDASIQVDLKGGSKIRGVKNIHAALRNNRINKVATCNLYGGQAPSALPDTTMYDAYDEQHVRARLEQIKPDHDKIKNCERLIEVVEKTLKKISDKLKEENGETGDDRLLRGVIRVGYLGEHLLLKTDKIIHTVLLCRDIPSISLLQKLVDIFVENVDDESEKDKVKVELSVSESAFTVSLEDVDLKCVVTLTSVNLRKPKTEKKEGEEAKEEPAVELPKDPLPKAPCLKALADLRHTKFFQQKCIEVQSLVEVVLLLRDVGNRIDTWSVFSLYVLELLVYKTIVSHPMPLRVSDAFRRFFEVMSTGQYLSIRSTLEDPCEKEAQNPLADLTKQQRENIICSAQHGLRLIAYDQIHTILGMERVEPQSRKRSAEDEDKESGVESKKEKVDAGMEEAQN